MQRFYFKDSRKGTEVQYILKIRESYGGVMLVDYSKNPNCTWGGGTIALTEINIIHD